MLPKLKKINCLLLITGSIIQAIGIYNIHAISDVTEGGVLGLTLLIRHWLGISPAFSSLILNLSCYFLGWKLMGKSFLAYSLISIFTYSASYRICELFPPFFPQIVQFPLLAAVAGALFIGIGAGLCVRAGGSTTGDDALAMSLNFKYGWPVERIYLFSDTLVLLLSLSYIPPRRIAYSLLTCILSGQIIGWIQKIPTHEKRATSV